ncbi:hypothetical protein CYMTET_43125 [Cymbomonas tetramitiformis]|uniref:Uncharacterized protein n=1 Tax=Cymbomonas tetramitiformis TaxID=36881 RepID=A0AAE0F0A6_9CHLO|nr:hypothetical protein CYMTET_43125 [Cymbomonas tetramitiformis]
MPVLHRTKDECGGGSAWLAWMLHGLAQWRPCNGLEGALRRADLLAALCQETRGDFSQVNALQLERAEVAWEGKPALLSATEGTTVGSGSSTLMITPVAADVRREQTLSSLKRAGVMAIVRAKGSPEVAVARGIELAALGCRCIEVTLDSQNWAAVLAELRSKLPPHVILGVGTVMDDTVCEVSKAAELGASFALSPIDPIGFVEECHRRGVVAVPSAFTSNEMWALHRRGVQLIKLFHAGIVSPSILKSMLEVSPLGANLNILPSGGVAPKNAASWWDAGATCVGMGSNLVGKDVGTIPGTPEHAAAVQAWEQNGRACAKELFAAVEERWPTAT